MSNVSKIRTLFNRENPTDFIAAVHARRFEAKYKHKPFIQSLDNDIRRLCPPELIDTEKKYARIRTDVVYSIYAFGASALDYFAYRFYAKTYAERRTFFTEFNRYEFYSYVNDKDAVKIFQDKYATYRNFSKYYGREVFAFGGASDITKLLDFSQRHDEFFVKPVKSSCGIGVKKYRFSDFSSLDKLTRIMLESGRSVVEEAIVQSDEMASLHAPSVNTLRVNTLVTDDGVKLLYPFMRVGHSNAFIDNAGSGGIIMPIDVNTGVVHLLPGDESLHRYIVHPDTGAQLVGFKVPRFDEAMKLAAELASVVPSVRFVGWDLALTDKGWVMVEGNDRAMFFCQQFGDRIGKREEHFRLAGIDRTNLS